MYTLDVARIRAIDPELIITQDLCRVCAVPSGAIEEALDVMAAGPTSCPLDPHSLDDVIDGIAAVGRATGNEGRAEALIAGLRARIAVVRGRCRVGGRGCWPRVVRSAVQRRALGPRDARRRGCGAAARGGRRAIASAPVE